MADVTIVVSYDQDGTYTYKNALGAIIGSSVTVKPNQTIEWLMDQDGSVTDLKLFFLDKGPLFGPAAQATRTYEPTTNYTVAPSAKSTTFPYITIIEDENGDLAPPDDPIIVLDVVDDTDGIKVAKSANPGPKTVIFNINIGGSSEQ